MLVGSRVSPLTRVRPAARAIASDTEKELLAPRDLRSEQQNKKKTNRPRVRDIFTALSRDLETPPPTHDIKC